MIPEWHTGATGMQIWLTSTHYTYSAKLGYRIDLLVYASLWSDLHTEDEIVSVSRLSYCRAVTPSVSESINILG